MADTVGVTHEQLAREAAEIVTAAHTREMLSDYVQFKGKTDEALRHIERQIDVARAFRTEEQRRIQDKLDGIVRFQYMALGGLVVLEVVFQFVIRHI